MGKIESKVRARAKKGALKRAILATVALGGLATVAMMAPNVLQLMPRRAGHMFGSPQSAIKSSVSKMKRDGLLAVEVRGGMRFLRITDRGKRYLERSANISVPKPRRWDKKWRIIIFDIEERRRSIRDSLRHTLSTIGFLRLQDSIWVYPYPCEDLIVLLKADLKIGKEILYIVAEEIENDSWIRDSFNLPKV